MRAKGITESHSFIAAICLGTILLSAPAINVQAQFNYRTLNFPGASGTQAYGIDGNNVVGSYSNTNGEGGSFLYNISSNTYTMLSLPGAPFGISGSNIVGSYGSVNSQEGFVYNLNSGTYTSLSVQGSTATFADGIDGTNVVGLYDFDYSPGNGAFAYIGDTFYYPYIPERTVGSGAYGISGDIVVGGAAIYDTGASQGFIANIAGGTTLMSMPGEENTFAYGVSGNNVVGVYWNGVQPYQAFLYNINSNTYTPFTVPGSTSTTAWGVSGNGIVGYYSTPNGTTYGFLATPSFKLTAVAVDGQIEVGVFEPSVLTTVQASTNLVSWTPVYTNTPPFTFTDASMAMFPSRFYRAVPPQ